jgi:sulfide dehydrogenase [flavocytochrome c] flavoprotein subunit
MNKLSRRNFLRLTGTTALAATAGLTACGDSETPTPKTAPDEKAASNSGAAAPPEPAPAQPPKLPGALGQAADLPKPQGMRVVVVGGGWSGLTLAKYLKKENPAFDVVLVEKRATFMSCPISNLWLADVVDLKFLTHSFIDAARDNNYTFFNATVVDVDRDSRRVYTDQGYLDYDYLALAPGIDYDYPAIGVTDPAELVALKQNYPGGFIPGSEHLSIKNKLEVFGGGVFVLTVPAGNYRCLPGPYERACMVASIFKQAKINGKVLLLDANPDITIKKEGFHNAFNELYKDIVEYRPSVEIKGVDVANREIKTEFDSIKFDDGAIYPKVRASRLIETLGLVNPQSLQKEANIDVFKYNVIGDERVYVTGDSRPMPFSKSGNTANSEAKYVAKVIAARAAGKDVEWESPNTICYSAVKIDPVESISVDAHYKFDPETKQFAFDKVKMFQKWDAERGQANLEWARGLYRDIFA